MKGFLQESELTERRAFIEPFVKEIIVTSSNVRISNSVPMLYDIYGWSGQRVGVSSHDHTVDCRPGDLGAPRTR